MGVVLLIAMAAGVGLLGSSEGRPGGEGRFPPPTPTGSSADCSVSCPPPETFFAVLGFGDTRILEVSTDSGAMIRTVVDLAEAESGPDQDDYIGSLDIDTGREALYFGMGLTGPLYRLRLPNGIPDRIGDGQGVRVSPDGRHLAFARGRDLVVRRLPDGPEEVFEGLFGDLGGRPGAWAADSRTLAVEIDTADTTYVVVLDTGTGETTGLKPQTGDPRNYRPYSPWFRRSDGLLAVVCCTEGEIIPGAPEDIPELILHNPATGEEHDRSPLRLPGYGYDYDPFGTHQLLTSEEGVWRRSDDVITRIPRIAGAYLAVW